VWANQFDNVANRLAHYESTGPEIWRDTEGKIDAFVTATGTGGTIAGVGEYLKEQNSAVQIVAADPYGSAIYNFVTSGETKMTPGPSITEGIGNSRVTNNLQGAALDDAIQIHDTEMVKMVYKLMREEGWFFGSSTGINMCAAVECAKKLGPGHTIVSILCDTGAKYQETLFNPEFLAERELPIE